MATPTVADMTLAVEYAEFCERVHQQQCRARMGDRPCAACLQYEADWLAADDALHAYLNTTKAGVA